MGSCFPFHCPSPFHLKEIKTMLQTETILPRWVSSLPSHPHHCKPQTLLSQLPSVCCNCCVLHLQDPLVVCSFLKRGSRRVHTSAFSLGAGEKLQGNGMEVVPGALYPGWIVEKDSLPRGRLGTGTASPGQRSQHQAGESSKTLGHCSWAQGDS